MMTYRANPALRCATVLMIVLLLDSDLAYGSWLSEITGVDINVPAGTISFSNPRPEAIPDMLRNLPADVLEFAINCLVTKGVTYSDSLDSLNWPKQSLLSDSYSS